MSRILTLISPTLLVALVLVIVIVAATLAFSVRMRRLDTQLGRILSRLEEAEAEWRRAGKQRPKPEDTDTPKRELQSQIDSLRSLIRNIPTETARQVETLLPQSPSRQMGAPPAPSTFAGDEPDEAGEREDGVAHLLTIANRIVQQSSTTLDAFRASAGALATRIAAWPSQTDGVPAAFIVEYRGAHYAVPNVVKPARLPKDWFNRSDFGVNDEIQSVVSLPRLRRHNDRYEVQEAGVFGR